MTRLPGNQSGRAVRSTIATLGVAVAVAGTIWAGAWAASASRAVVSEHVQDHAIQLEDHEARLRCLERQSSEIAADVKWIRRTLEARAR